MFSAVRVTAERRRMSPAASAAECLIAWANETIRGVRESGSGMEERLNGHPLGRLLRRAFGHGNNLFRVQACPRNQNFGVSGVAFYASSGRIGPGVQLGIRSIPELLGQGLRNVSHGVGAPPQLNQTCRPVRSINGRRVKRDGQRVDSIAELLPCDRVCAPRVRNIGERLAQQVNGVFYTSELVCSEGRFLDQLAATVAQGKQMPGEIPAVHGRYVLGLKRKKFARVVPVVEVTAT